MSPESEPMISSVPSERSPTPVTEIVVDWLADSPSLSAPARLTSVAPTSATSADRYLAHISCRRGKTEAAEDGPTSST
jgi:hypothetical protein